ncbi:hypothetical protein A9P82_10420 [Arachidicoccus ginsenosidimutans]|uniref:FecR family protein n=1 Tax=Arachidicoccus sp. BS20 TaxID=1850526 RepID=UPI0007F0D02C|nr:FecR family protein [Arachidicoccus sp. BS20]ANI89665.1 hypothetical protein A9P82_10420 [Arachidicoccus sp. BS20]
MLKIDEIRLMLYKYRMGICDDAEKETIESWYQNVLDKTEWNIDEATAELIKINIKNKLDRELNLGSKTKIFKINWYKVAISIAALFIIMFGIRQAVMHQAGKNEKAIAASVAEHDIAPGGNKAILTLADGSKVMLDSVRKGLVVNQIGCNIVKTDSGLLTYQRNNKDGNLASVGYNILSTPRGGQYKLILPDGSKVWLNAASSIRYPVAFAGKERVVEITGEAYFEVIHNDKLPFRVKTGNSIVEDVGTHFNINAYSDEPNMKVSLLEGKVRINTNKASTILVPGQQGQINNIGIVKVTTDTDIESSVAWKNGYFDFEDGENLQGIMRQISRWYDVNVEYEGNVPDMHFGGKITRDCNLSEVLKILSYSNIRYRMEDKNLIIMK